jgi:hypothetical protein
MSLIKTERYYDDVKAVAKATNEDECNKLLAKGWKILKIAEDTTFDLTTKSRHTSYVYILGSTKDEYSYGIALASESEKKDDYILWKQAVSQVEWREITTIPYTDKVLKERAKTADKVWVKSTNDTARMLKELMLSTPPSAILKPENRPVWKIPQIGTLYFWSTTTDPYYGIILERG